MAGAPRRGDRVGCCGCDRGGCRHGRPGEACSGGRAHFVWLFRFPEWENRLAPPPSPLATTPAQLARQPRPRLGHLILGRRPPSHRLLVLLLRQARQAGAGRRAPKVGRRRVQATPTLGRPLASRPARGRRGRRGDPLHVRAHRPWWATTGVGSGWPGSGVRVRVRVRVPSRPSPGARPPSCSRGRVRPSSPPHRAAATTAAAAAAAAAHALHAEQSSGKQGATVGDAQGEGGRAGRAASSRQPTG